MERTLSDVLTGGLGYFWVLEHEKFGDLLDEDAHSGFVRRDEDVVRVDLLQEDPLKAWIGGHRSTVPVALVGVTEHTGVGILDVTGTTSNVHMGGARSSVERFRAVTVVAGPEVVDAKSLRVSEVAVTFRGSALLGWANLDASTHKYTYDDEGKVQAAEIHLKPTVGQTARLTPGRSVKIDSRWGLTGTDGLENIIDTSLQVTIETRRPVRFRELLLPLLRCQELLSVAFGGFLPAYGGHVVLDGTSSRLALWNATLMPHETNHIKHADVKTRPFFYLPDIGGVAGVVRWIRLWTRYPRAVAPVIHAYRLGRSADASGLLEIAAAIEYWVAAHRRAGSWARRGSNFAEALALHVGRDFDAWVGDAKAWAALFWDYYTGLKHDPSFVPDPFVTRVLRESAHLALLADLLNRVAGSKKPSRRLMSNYKNRQLRDWVNDVVPPLKA